MNLREKVTVAQSRIDELTLRERAILFLVLATLLFVVFSKLLIDPQEARQKQILNSISKTRSEIAQLEEQKLNIIKHHSEDPNAADLARLAQLQQASSQIEGEIRTAIDGLIEPQEMARALEGVLKEQRQLTFVRINNLGATPLLEIAPVDGNKADAGIYKHTMRIELEGSFHHTRDYLQVIEQLPWKFHWESVDIEIIDYPLAKVVITVNTLSLSEGWIGV